MADLTRRVQRELYDCMSSFKESGITLTLHDEAILTSLRGTIPGPVDSPYEGGTFEIHIFLHDDYPFQPPHMCFATKVWHPNISSQTGAICLDILSENWSPAQTLMSALVSIQALLSTPEPTDPQDAQVARQYIAEHEKFLETARAWTKLYATVSS